VPYLDPGQTGRYDFCLHQRDGRLSWPWCWLYSKTVYLSHPTKYYPLDSDLIGSRTHNLYIMHTYNFVAKFGLLNGERWNPQLNRLCSVQCAYRRCRPAIARGRAGSPIRHKRHSALAYENNLAYENFRCSLACACTAATDNICVLVALCMLFFQ